MYDLVKLIEEAIKIELGISKLYQLFSLTIPEDSGFWWRLALEEGNHASILKTGKDMVPIGKFPKEMIPETFDELVSANEVIRQAQQKFQDDPSRIYAFEIAHELELSTGEIHFHKYLSSGSHDKLKSIFRQLNRDDVDHARRIKKQWELALQQEERANRE